MLAEVVVLIGRGGDIRPYVLKPPHEGAHIFKIVEQCHQPSGKVQIRYWYNRWDERCLTGQRVFREEDAPSLREFVERPLLDELHVKTPLFTPEYLELVSKAKPKQ